MKKCYQATGKRKTAISQVVLQSSFGSDCQATVFSPNFKSGVTLEKFFSSSILSKRVLKPFVLTKTLGDFNVKIKVKGGGFSGQADASCHAIAKALVKFNSTHSIVLKVAKLLTRDARIKERKKYGLKKARKAPQFSKR